jgi:hypothetical protein
MPEPIIAVPGSVEVAPGLFVGGAGECVMPGQAWTRGAQRSRWSAVVHACKYPCHAETLGYAGKGKMDPGAIEYLTAYRGDHLVLNMIDAEERFFRLEVFQAALDHIQLALKAAEPRVLVHCNQGASRSPSIALLYVAKRTTLFDPLDRATYDAARKAFEHVYPLYKPGAGIAGFLDRWWERLA